MATIEKTLKKYWLTKSNPELCEMLDISDSTLRRHARKIGLPPKVGGGHNKKEFTKITAKEAVALDKKKISEKNTSTTLEKKYEYILKRHDELERTLSLMSNVKTIHSFNIKENKREKSEATAIIMASDWHVGETVDPETIGGVNEYNREIAQKRGKQFFTNALRLLKIFEKDIYINNVILALLGDFITNTIHEELAETNSMLPSDEISFAQDLIVSGIEFLLKNTTVNFIIPCHSGNHGRMTKKQRISSEAGNSLEYFMYKNIAYYFKNEKRITFLIPRGYFSFVQVYDKVVRFHHGHHLSYGGGVGGVTIPINKAIAQWDKTKKADIDCFGHFHQFLNGGKWILNGSMMGFNAYAESIKASYEPPKQAFFLIDKKRGQTVVCPITFDD